LYIDFVIKILNIVIWVVRNTLNICEILFSRISRSVKLEFQLLKKKEIWYLWQKLQLKKIKIKNLRSNPIVKNQDGRISKNWYPPNIVLPIWESWTFIISKDWPKRSTCVKYRLFCGSIQIVFQSKTSCGLAS